MVEDQLMREERIRLEALNQAVHSASLRDTSALSILERAEKFADYIKEGKIHGS